MENLTASTDSKVLTLEDIKHLITPFNEAGKAVIGESRVSHYRASEVLLRASNNTLTQEDKLYILRNLDSNTYFKCAIPVMGVKFDFSPFLKLFWVEISTFDSIQKFYAIDIESLELYLSEKYDYDEEEDEYEATFTIVEVPQNK